MANEYINKVVANNNTLIDLTSDTAEASDVLQGRTLHLASGAPAVGTYRPSDEIVSRLEATVGHSGKNQLSFGSQNLTKTIAGVTFTVDPVAGTVTANGTSTSSSGSQYFIRIVGKGEYSSLSNYPTRSIPNGQYYFCGCPSGGSVGKTTYNVYVSILETGTRAKKWDGSTNVDTDYGVETKNELLINDQSSTLIYSIRVFDTNGQNKVFRPMIWSGDIDDDTFEPYIEPTDRQIETKARAYLTSSLGHVSKNVFNLYTHRTIPANITLSTCDNETGTIIANATGAWKAISWEDNRFIQDSTKRYIVSGTNNIANSLGRISINNRTDQLAYTKVNLSSTGSFSFEIVPSDYPDGFWLQVYMTSTSSTTATGSVNISNFMLREAVIEDDTFEPYCMPIDILMARLDDRISALETASKPTPDPDEGQYYITVYNNTGIDLLYLILTTPQNDGGEFNPRGGSTKSVHKDMLYFGGVFGVLFEAGTSDTVMSITNAGTWNHDFDVDEFLNMCDDKDGSATNYISIHLCDDGGIRNQAEYEAYIGS